MKSQKARGVMLLPYLFSNSHRHVLFDKSTPQTFASLSSKLNVYGDSEVFARPCPTRPRHGFVESRVVKTIDEINALMTEAQKEDPDAEIILSKKIKASCSAVLTIDGILNIGPDHDGATSGRGAFQVLVPPTDIHKNFLELANVKENAYIESVFDSENRMTWIVQFRDGPKQNSLSSNFIPKVTKVKNVIVPCDDLLAWEKTVANLAEGDVVYANGHGLTSHAAVHCVLHGIPFITEYRPNIGDTLTPEVAAFSFNELDFSKGRAIGKQCILAVFDGYSDKFQSNQVYDLALSMFHGWARLQYDKKASYWAGFFSEVIYLLSVMAIVGECRHADSEEAHLDRHRFYKKVDLTKRLDRKIKTSMRVFDKSKDFEPGYGGPAWAQCSELTRQLHNTINTNNLNDSLKVINLIINQSHNSGAFLDKFYSKDTFDKANSETALMIMNSQAVLMHVHSAYGAAASIVSEGVIDLATKKQLSFNGSAILSTNNDKMPSEKSSFMKLLYGDSYDWVSFKAKKNHFEHKVGNLVFKIY